MRLLVGLIAGFMLGAHAMRRAIEQQQAAPMPDDIDWLSEFLLTHVPDPALARSN